MEKCKCTKNQVLVIMYLLKMLAIMSNSNAIVQHILISMEKYFIVHDLLRSVSCIVLGVCDVQEAHLVDCLQNQICNQATCPC